MLAGDANLLKVWNDVFLPKFFGLFEQHLAVADYSGDGRPEVVTQPDPEAFEIRAGLDSGDSGGIKGIVDEREKLDAGGIYLLQVG